jgi:5'-nucleotidase
MRKIEERCQFTMKDNTKSIGVLAFLAIFFILLILLTIFVVLLFVFHDEVNNLHIKRDEKLFKLSIIHFNDFHSRFEEIDENSSPCKGNNCVGGIARMTSVIKKLKDKRENSIVLNAGDNFEGTFWYYLFKSNVTSEFLNLIPVDASVIGNHDFANKLNGLVPFVKSLKFPVVLTNIDVEHEPRLKDLFKKSIILERDGRKIGIIGIIYREVSSTTITTGNLKFLDEAQAIRNEATLLRQKGVNIIIVLSHCGIDRDREIALETGDFVDIIVGGHSHSFLYTSKNGYIPSNDVPIESYPLVISPKSGKNRKVLIVQAFAFTKYVGDLTIYFNEKGHVKYYEGNPILISNEISKDPEVEKRLIPWRDEVNKITSTNIGVTEIDLLHDEQCRSEECLLGNFVCDSFIHETKRAFIQHNISAAIIHAGGLKGNLMKGNITVGDVLNLFPYSDTLDIVILKGETLFELFEHAISRSWNEDKFIGAYMLQVSGFQLTFNITKPLGERLQKLQIRSNISEDFEEVNVYQSYTLIIPSFLANGGDGFTMISTSKLNHTVGLLDVDVMRKSIERNSPISVRIDGRIVVLK